MTTGLLVADTLVGQFRRGSSHGAWLVQYSVQYYSGALRTNYISLVRETTLGDDASRLRPRSLFDINRHWIFIIRVVDY